MMQVITLFGWGVEEGREGKGRKLPLLFLFGWKFNRRLRLIEVTHLTFCKVLKLIFYYSQN
jgi:hypothetical protein